MHSLIPALYCALEMMAPILEKQEILYALYTSTFLISYMQYFSRIGAEVWAIMEQSWNGFRSE